MTGTLDLTALSPGNQFNINLWSLASTGPDINGNIVNFDPTSNYEWLAVVASNIIGFDASYFKIATTATNSTGGFGNPTESASAFSVRQDGGNLYISYTVPEPSTYVMLALAGAGFAGYTIRRRRK